MSRSPEIYPVYLKVQPRIHEVQDVLQTLHAIFDSHPEAQASVKGVGVDEHIVRLFVEILVPISDRDPRAVASLRCAQNIFETLFAQLPSYCAAPNPVELRLAEKFLGVTSPAAEGDATMQESDATMQESISLESSTSIPLYV